MAKLTDLVAGIEKKAETEGSFGGDYTPIERVPTGIFPLDLAIGGGIPRGRITEIYGAEGSCKTNVAMLTIAQNQILHPEQKNAFIDMEGTWDPHWAKRLGVNTENVYVIRPDYAEQVADVMNDLLDAEDLGVCVLDSLAAMGTIKEIDDDMDKQQMAESARIIGRMTRKVIVKMKRKHEAGHAHCAVIWINQIRSKVGFVMGNPETTPGGNMPKFAYSLRLRLYGKPVIDAKVSKAMPIAREVTLGVPKYKVGITAINAEFTLMMMEHSGFRAGECDDWNLAEALLREEGVLTEPKKGKGWVMFGETYPTLKACKEKYRADAAFRLKVQKDAIGRALAANGVLAIDPETGEVNAPGV